MDISIVSLVATLIVAATPILLAATGELIVEKAGVLNLGVEGMMIIGAICGFIAAVNTSSPLMGFVAAAAAGADNAGAGGGGVGPRQWWSRVGDPA